MAEPTTTEVERDLKGEVDSPVASDTEAAGSKINEKALLRKIDGRLLPAVGVLYLLSFLDRSNGEYIYGAGDAAGG
jgi:hypothetical protein